MVVFRGLSADAAMALKEALAHTADRILEPLKQRRHFLQTFRCACGWGKSLSDGALTADQWADLCVQCGIVAARKHEPRATMFVPAAVDSVNIAASASPPDLSPIDAQLFQKVRDYALQKKLDDEEDRSDAVPIWREDEEAPTIGGFSRKLSIGKGLKRRRAHSTRALQNLTMALSTADSETIKSVVLPLPEEYVRSAFFFVTSGAETASFREFVMLCVVVIDQRHHDRLEEDPHAAAHTLIMDCFLHYYKEHSPENLDDVMAKRPLRRFPGVEDVVSLASNILRRVFNLFGGGSKSMDYPQFARFLDQIGVYKYPHVGDAETRRIFRLVSTCEQMDYFEFIDSVALVAFMVYTIDPMRTALPTLASRLYTFILSWKEWFSSNFSRKFEEEVVPPPAEPPTILSITPMTCDPKVLATVTIIGKNFGSGGVYVRFGQCVTVGATTDACPSTNVAVPPQATDTVTIRLNQENGDLEVVVVQQKMVSVSVSLDGNHFSKPFDDPFVYEDRTQPINLFQYLPKLHRIFENYVSLNDPG